MKKGSNPSNPSGRNATDNETIVPLQSKAKFSEKYFSNMADYVEFITGTMLGTRVVDAPKITECSKSLMTLLSSGTSMKY